MQTIRCPQCGEVTEFEEGEEVPRFCGQCGRPLAAEASSPPVAQLPAKLPPVAPPMPFGAPSLVKPAPYSAGLAPVTFMAKINGAPPPKQRRDTRWAPSFQIQLADAGLWLSGKHRQSGKAAGIAVVLTVAGIALALMSQAAGGFGCAPGFILWWAILDIALRKSVVVPVDTLRARAAYDPATRRFSLEVQPDRWLTFRLTGPAVMDHSLHELLAKEYGARFGQQRLPLLSTGQKVGMSIVFGLIGLFLFVGLLLASLSR